MEEIKINGDTKVLIPELTEEENNERLKKLYDLCNEIFKGKDCFAKKESDNNENSNIYSCINKKTS